MLHIREDVKCFQISLDEFAAFQFESYLGKLKQFLRGKHNSLRQIVKQCKELKGDIYIKKSQPSKVNESGKDSCFLTTSGVAFVK